MPEQPHLTQTIRVTLKGPIVTGKGRELVRLGINYGFDVALPYVQRVLTLNTPSGATGLLRKSVAIERSELDGNLVGFVGYAGAPSLYAQFVDQGRRPGKMPPVDAIAYWAIRVLHVVDPNAHYLIARAIGRRGTKAQNMVAKTVGMVRERVVGYMQAGFKKAIEEKEASA